MKKSFLLFYLMTVLFVSVLSYTYEFWLEDKLDLTFIGGDAASDRETTAQHLKYVFTVTMFSAIALFLPAVFAYKLYLKIHEVENERLTAQAKLDEALTKLLSGFMRICSVCKKVRVENEQKKDAAWTSIDSYVSQRTDLMFSHGYCPECAEKAMAEMENEKSDKG